MKNVTKITYIKTSNPSKERYEQYPCSYCKGNIDGDFHYTYENNTKIGEYIYTWLCSDLCAELTIAAEINKENP